MPTFTYKGAAADGTEVTETVEVADRYAVYEEARKAGHTVTSVAEARRFPRLQRFNMERLNALISRVKQDDLVMLSRNLAAMLKAGLALSRALSVAERQNSNPAVKRILHSVRDDVETGKQFNEALAAHPKAFSPLYVAMVRAGEESGGLAEALETLSLQLERSSNLKKKVRGAMIYPAIVIAAMGIIGVLMLIYVVPTLTATFRELDVELPLATRTLLSISDFLSQNTILALVLIVMFTVGIIGIYRLPQGRRAVEWMLIHMPVIGGLVKQVNAARTARTLSSLLRAGVDVVQALSITGDVVQNSFYRTVIASAAADVEKGRPMSEVFIENEYLYPVLVGEMMAVGEETGQIANMLEEIADFYESEVERQTKDLSTIIEPILMVVIGAAVGFFALAMIAPIYSISDSIE